MYFFCGSFLFSLSCVLCLFARLFICALWSPAGKDLNSWLSFLVSKCEIVTFPLGQVWYLIVSIPDLCTLSYYEISTSQMRYDAVDKDKDQKDQ